MQQKIQRVFNRLLILQSGAIGVDFIFPLYEVHKFFIPLTQGFVSHHDNLRLRFEKGKTFI
jgi:hypothetical protein